MRAQPLAFVSPHFAHSERVPLLQSIALDQSGESLWLQCLTREIAVLCEGTNERARVLVAAEVVVALDAPCPVQRITPAIVVIVEHGLDKTIDRNCKLA